MAGINGLGSTNAYCFTLRASGNQKRIEDRLNSNQNDKLGGVKANPTRTPLDIESWEYIILKDKEPLEKVLCAKIEPLEQEPLSADIEPLEQEALCADIEPLEQEALCADIDEI